MARVWRVWTPVMVFIAGFAAFVPCRGFANAGAAAAAPAPRGATMTSAPLPGILEREAEPGVPDFGNSIASVDSNYEQAESVGEVVQSSDNRVDGSVTRFRDGHLFGKVGSSIELAMLPGRKAAVGAEYLVYRNAGELVADLPARQDLGELDLSIGVVRVTRIMTAKILALVVRQYSYLQEGDLIRLRAGVRRRYDALLDLAAPSNMKSLTGEVVGMVPPKLLGAEGDIIYVSLGTAKGLRPGMRLRIDDDLSDRALPADNDDTLMPMSPVDPLVSARDEVGSALPNGAIAIVEVVNASRWASSTRVLRETSVVRVGARVLYP